jgi:hypothetical protein
VAPLFNLWWFTKLASESAGPLGNFITHHPHHCHMCIHTVIDPCFAAGEFCPWPSPCLTTNSAQVATVTLELNMPLCCVLCTINTEGCTFHSRASLMTASWVHTCGALCIVEFNAHTKVINAMVGKFTPGNYTSPSGSTPSTGCL